MKHITVIVIFSLIIISLILIACAQTTPLSTSTVSKIQNNQVSCPSNVSMKYVMLKGKNEICYDESEKLIKFILFNSGKENIQSVQAEILGSQKTIDYNPLDDSFIAPGKYLNSKMAYDDQNFGKISKVILTPIITADNQSISCNDKVLEIAYVNIC